MNYMSLFSGIEAASCAWEDLNLNPILFSEIDPYPASVLKYHYPSVPNVGDITKVDWSEYSGKIDLIVGGSPCQSFSYAGKREGLNGESRLCLSILELFKRYVQNGSFGKTSPGVLSSGRGNDFRFLLNSLAELGYSLAWRILDSKYFGVPQQRRRVFVVGCIGSGGSPAEVLFEREILQRSIGESEPIRKRLAKSDGRSNKKSNKLKTIFCIANSTAKAECYENLSPTLTAHNGAVAPFISFNPPRHLMPIECERIQGFPDNWTNVPGPNENFLVIQEDIK